MILAMIYGLSSVLQFDHHACFWEATYVGDRLVTYIAQVLGKKFKPARYFAKKFDALQ